MPPLTLAQRARARQGLGPSGLYTSRANPQTSPPVTLDSGEAAGAPDPAPYTIPPAGGGFAGGGATSGGGSGIRGGAFTGDAKEFLSSLYNARPKFVAQQEDLLSRLGPSLRQAVFTASPELAAASDYLTKTFADPYGGSRSTFEDAIRSAQAARGFTGGGTGIVGEEARYLTNFAEQRRMQLLPQLQGFGNNILQISGLSAPTDVNLASLGNLALQNRQLNSTIQSNQAQDAFSQRLYEDYLATLKSSNPTTANPFGTPKRTSTIVGSSPFNQGRTFSGQSGGGNSAGTFDASGNLVSTGNGLEFGKGTAQDRYTAAKILQASGKITTEAQYLAYINGA